MTTSYEVCVTNQGSKRFDTAKEAVSYTARQLYVGPEKQASAIKELEAGKAVNFVYGFADAGIVPVGGQ